MARKFVVTGIPQLDVAMAKFEPKLRKKIERKAIRAAGKPVLTEAKKNARQISPSIARLLTLRAAKKQSKKNIVGVRIATTRTATTDTGGVLNPHWFEFGAPGHLAWGKGEAPLPERPFVRPAIETSRPKVRGVFRERLRQLVVETAHEVETKPHGAPLVVGGRR